VGALDARNDAPSGPQIKSEQVRASQSQMQPAHKTAQHGKGLTVLRSTITSTNDVFLVGSLPPSKDLPAHPPSPSPQYALQVTGQDSHRWPSNPRIKMRYRMRRDMSNPIVQSANCPSNKGEERPSRFRSCPMSCRCQEKRQDASRCRARRYEAHSARSQRSGPLGPICSAIDTSGQCQGQVQQCTAWRYTLLAYWRASEISSSNAIGSQPSPIPDCDSTWQPTESDALGGAFESRDPRRRMLLRCCVRDTR
jgi:hypothetical protein